MKKKILIASVHLETGGIEKTLISILNKLDYTKYDVDLLLLKTNGIFIKDVPKEVNIIKPYKAKILENICNSYNIFCKLIKHILFNYYTSKLWKLKKEYDTAISYGGYYPFIDNLVANAKAKKKYIWVHTNLSAFENSKYFKMQFNLTKGKYEKFDNIVCVSQSIKEIFDNLLPNYKDKTIVKYNIVDIKENKEKVLKLSGKFKIISVGRLSSQKRFDRLIDVHKKLIDNNYDVKTYIAGSGDMYDELNNKINDLKLCDSIFLLGNQKNVIPLVRQADLFLLTSDYEGLPTVLIETLYAGVPFVGTNVCGIKDIANDIAPKNSFLLAEPSIDEIYEKVVKVIDNKDKYHKFNFDINKYNNDCFKEFENLIK